MKLYENCFRQLQRVADTDYTILSHDDYKTNLIASSKIMQYLLKKGYCSKGLYYSTPTKTMPENAVVLSAKAIKKAESGIDEQEGIVAYDAIDDIVRQVGLGKSSGEVYTVAMNLYTRVKQSIPNYYEPLTKDRLREAVTEVLTLYKGYEKTYAVLGAHKKFEYILCSSIFIPYICKKDVKGIKNFAKLVYSYVQTEGIEKTLHCLYWLDSYCTQVLLRFESILCDNMDNLKEIATIEKNLEGYPAKLVAVIKELKTANNQLTAFYSEDYTDLDIESCLRAIASKDFDLKTAIAAMDRVIHKHNLATAEPSYTSSKVYNYYCWVQSAVEAFVTDYMQYARAKRRYGNITELVTSDSSILNTKESKRYLKNFQTSLIAAIHIKVKAKLFNSMRLDVSDLCARAYADRRCPEEFLSDALAQRILALEMLYTTKTSFSFKGKMTPTVEYENKLLDAIYCWELAKYIHTYLFCFTYSELKDMIDMCLSYANTLTNIFKPEEKLERAEKRYLKITGTDYSDDQIKSYLDKFQYAGYNYTNITIEQTYSLMDYGFKHNWLQREGIPVGRDNPDTGDITDKLRQYGLELLTTATSGTEPVNYTGLDKQVNACIERAKAEGLRDYVPYIVSTPIDVSELTRYVHTCIAYPLYDYDTYKAIYELDIFAKRLELVSTTNAALTTNNLAVALCENVKAVVKLFCTRTSVLYDSLMKGDLRSYYQVLSYFDRSINSKEKELSDVSLAYLYKNDAIYQLYSRISGLFDTLACVIRSLKDTASQDMKAEAFYNKLHEDDSYYQNRIKSTYTAKYTAFTEALKADADLKSALKASKTAFQGALNTFAEREKISYAEYQSNIQTRLARDNAIAANAEQERIKAEHEIQRSEAIKLEAKIHEEAEAYAREQERMRQRSKAQVLAKLKKKK